jgi:hypothetical protein
MKLFPIIVFEKRTTKNFDEVKSILELIKNSDKYQGFWEDETLFITKFIWFPNKITPHIKVEIRNDQLERRVLVSCDLRNRFKVAMKAVIFLLTIMEIIIIYRLFKNHSFHFLVFGPILMIFFMYLITFICYKLECDDFRYELSKQLNRA